MSTDSLAELDMTPAQALELPGRERNRLLSFFARWQRLEALHTCLDLLIPAYPHLVSLLDLRVRALISQGRGDEAVTVMKKRIEIKTSVSARILLARAHLADQDLEAARQIAAELVERRPDSIAAWGLLADTAIAQGHIQVAQEACQRLHDLNPHSRAYLLKMLALYQASDDWVTASGYAVRLLRTATADDPLPVDYVRTLVHYFQASGEPTRVAELQAELARRYPVERAEIENAIAPGPRGAAPAPAKPRRPAPTPTAAEAAPDLAAVSAPSFEVPVSAPERARIEAAAHHLFGFTRLLPGQLETLACVLRGEDVLAILPTGGGKSLCYQLPAMLAERGTTLVISPLIALMKDQVDSLPGDLRSRATTINSSLDGQELAHRLEQARQGAYRLVYAAPERLRQPTFLHAMRRANLKRLVIDEAHCVSVWGHDFRPDYLAIGQVRQALDNPPLLALTATAPPRVRRDIVHHLGDLRIIAGDVTRPNLLFEVFHACNVDDKLEHLVTLCQGLAGSSIVYVDTRARSEELASLLRRLGLSAQHYHAGISDRDRVQDDFMAGRTRIIVATVAFGMGIDKPDIRTIVHFAPPPSLEAYYQEAGRAGRDGQPARCVLLYAPSDRGTLTRRARRDMLSIDFLRATYAAVQRRLDGAAYGRVTVADLERDLQADDTRIRVALSLLEEAGLLRRGPDVPRAALICAHQAPQADAWADFCETAHLRPGQWLNLDLVQVARQMGQHPAGMERKILEWADRGWLDYRPSGRDMLLERLPPPPEAAQRINALIERYEMIQAQRGDEIVAYAQTRRCRHGHINAYLGGRDIARCTACDNCVEIRPPEAAALPSIQEQYTTILRCIADSPWSWGRRTLVRILRGNISKRRRAPALHPKAAENACFGALAFRAPASIERMLDRLEGSGLLQARRLDHGGIVVELTDEGRKALHDAARLSRLLAPPSPSQARPGDAPQEPDEQDLDESLYEKLRTWRREQARIQQVPPFVVFHDRHLAAIATDRPTDLQALQAVMGVGPRKLEQYGQEIVRLVNEHLEDTD